MTFDYNKVTILQKIDYHSSGVTTCDFGSNYYLATGSGLVKMFIIYFCINT